jgi:hypothetical protein
MEVVRRAGGAGRGLCVRAGHQRVEQVEKHVIALKRGVTGLAASILRGPGPAEVAFLTALAEVEKSTESVTSRVAYGALEGIRAQTEDALPKKWHAGLEKSTLAYVDGWEREVAEAKMLHKDYEESRVKKDHYRDKVAELQGSIRTLSASGKRPSDAESLKVVRNEEKYNTSVAEYEEKRRQWLNAAAFVWRMHQARVDVVMLRYVQLERVRYEALRELWASTDIRAAEENLLRAAKDAATGGLAIPPGFDAEAFKTAPLPPSLTGVESTDPKALPPIVPLEFPPKGLDAAAGAGTPSSGAAGGGGGAAAVTKKKSMEPTPSAPPADSTPAFAAAHSFDPFGAGGEDKGPVVADESHKASATPVKRAPNPFDPFGPSEPAPTTAASSGTFDPFGSGAGASAADKPKAFDPFNEF